MHTAEEVRFLATVYTGEDHGAVVREALLAYANLLEAMDETAAIDYPPIQAAIMSVRQRAAEIAARRKGNA